MLFADIIFPLKMYFPLTYRIPENMENTLQEGDIVLCPLRAKAHKYGCVIKIHSCKPGFKVKNIVTKADSLWSISPHILALSQWISTYYCQAPGIVIEHASFWGVKPPQLKWKDYLFVQGLPENNLFNDDVLKACQDLKSSFLLTKSKFLRKKGVNNTLLEELINKGFVGVIDLPGNISEEEARRFTMQSPHTPQFHELTDSQAEIKSKIFHQIMKKKAPTFLLHGITGSGKTELYCHLIEHIIQEGKDVIFLVPEVSLVGQTVRYLQSRFGNLVTWYHYLRTASDKLAVSSLIRKRRVRILVGTRSAVFAPFTNLGLILVDEEHSGSYKSEEAPTYNARDVAIFRGFSQNFPVILGSATPSIESYYQSRKGKYTHLSLPERFNLNPLPDIHIIDLQNNFREYDPQTMMSKVLQDKVRQVIDKNKQVLLFLNRRGFSTFQMCLQCGQPVMCKYCRITLTYHKRFRNLKCHYCNFQQPAEKTCLHCRSDQLHFFGAGTQKIEDNLKNLFPEAGVLRIDSDVVYSRKKLEETENKIQSGNYQVLIGTQMITKGLHLKKLSLVGILDIDYMLTLPDFRAAEKAFSLILQAAGRAGRSSPDGEVYVQTFMKDHAIFRALKNHSYEDFYRPEIKFRKNFAFPPFSRLIRIVISGLNEETVKKGCYSLAGYLQNHPDKDYHIIGPTRCPIEKIKSRYRYMFLIRYRYPSPIQNILTKVQNNPVEYIHSSTNNIQVDTDPLNFL